MVSKISGNKPSAIQTPKAEVAKAPPKAAPAAAPAAGWGATGAAKGGKVAGPASNASAQVKLLSAKIDSMPAADKMIAPKGYEAISTDDKRTDTAALIDGRTAKFEWTSASLSVKGPDGKVRELVGKDDAGFKGSASDFQDNFKGLKKEDMEFLNTDWDSSRSFGGVGSAGNMMSVTQNDGYYMGGAHPDFNSSLATYDVTTGAKVTLDQLVSKEQMANIVATIASTLPKLKGEDGIDGQTFQPYQDISKMVAENFALTSDSKGNPQITVAWMSGVHALGDQAATFTFAAPTDSAFRQKIGLE
jgi:hypothetical protein